MPADLPGYGDSGKPAPDAAGLAYSKRAMAGDQAGLMRQLGFAQFQPRITTGSSCPPAGHFLPEEAPGLVTTVLCDFFGRVPGNTPVGDAFSRLWF